MDKSALSLSLSCLVCDIGNAAISDQLAACDFTLWVQLVVTSATLVVTGALLVVTRS